MTTRRSFLQGSLAAIAGLPIMACRASQVAGPSDPGDARLTARPTIPTVAASAGESALGLSLGRDGVLYVPASYDPSVPAPLFIALHGASGDAAGWQGFYPASENRNLILLVPESRSYTWDRVLGRFGPDVAFLDRALTHCFQRCNIDPSRVALGGFSDGASYALSLGLSNGDLFTHLVAFSPGFVAAGRERIGKPRVFVSHGTADGILPVTLSRDGIVPTLRDEGYDVRYDEFAGGHDVPSEIGSTALDWFLAA